MTIRPTVHIKSAPLTTVGGWALISGAATGAASALLLASITPVVGDDRFSYPLSPGAFSALQVFFCIHHLVLALGFFAVWRSGLAGNGRLSTVGGLASAISMALLGVQELFAISAANEPYPSAQTDLVEGIYGALSILNGLALIVFGIAAVRAGSWTGWRGLAILGLGIYVLVPLTPAIFGPFILARLTIGLWFLLFAGLGWALLHPRSAQ